MSNSLWPHELQHARLPCPSPSPGACSNSCPLSRWCHPNTSSSAAPFSFYLQSFPASGSFPISKVFALGVQSPHFIYIVGSLQRQQGGSSCLIKLISLTFFLPEAHHTLLVLRTPGSPSGLHVGAILYSKTAKKSSKIAKKKKKMRHWIYHRRDAYLGSECWNQKAEHPSRHLIWTRAWILWQCLPWHGNNIGVHHRQ